MTLPGGFVPYMAPIPAPPHSRRGGLIAFGVISIAIGALSGCLALTTPLSLMATAGAPRTRGSPPPPDVLSIVLALGFYAVVAVAFITLGIGSCRCKRWVRPLVLSLMWPWMIGGLVALVAWLAIGSQLLASLPIPSGTPPSQAAMMRTIIFYSATAMLAFIYVVVPLAYILFYRSRHVLSTAEYYDPIPAWTDRCPTQILGLSIWLIIGAFGMLAALAHPCIPLFGTYLSGPAAILGILAVAAFMAIAGVLCYRLQMAGWFLTTALITLMPISAALTFARRGLVELYERGGFPREQVEQIRNMSAMNSPWLVAMTWAFGLICLLYMLYAMKFFRQPRDQR